MLMFPAIYFSMKEFKFSNLVFMIYDFMLKIDEFQIQKYDKMADSSNVT